MRKREVICGSAGAGIPSSPPVARRSWRRAIWMTLALPPVLAAFGGLSIAYRIYASNRALTASSAFAVEPQPTPGQRLLVFAPHCDDEALGAAGLMHEARLHGSDVRVVVITNGDGFRIGVEREYRELSVPARDFVKYAYKRQHETLAAMNVVGVPADHVFFLGYPDRGLMPMWTTHWAPDDPYYSPFTKTDHDPYTDTPSAGAPYCGQDLLKDIEHEMEADKPTDIYVTHPGDDHPDHAAASVFVHCALDDLRARGEGWAKAAHLHYYLVHHGDWPAPQGLHEDYALTPPAQMANLDTHWTQFPLSQPDIKTKFVAISEYPSQTEMTSRFLFSFARRTELFGTIDDPVGLTRVPDGAMVMDGSLKGWRNQSPIERDPVGDSVVRAFQGDADLSRIYLCRDSRFLYIRLDMAQRVSRRVAYLVTIRPQSPTGPSEPAEIISVTPGPEGVPQEIPDQPGVTAAWRGSSLTVRAPLTQVGVNAIAARTTLYVAAETRFAGIQIDKSGYRSVACAAALGSRTASR